MRGKRGLTAITAVVVGLILNFALFFGEHVLWPRDLHGRFDWVSALIALDAAAALMHFRRSVIRIIAACAVAGPASKAFLP